MRQSLLVIGSLLILAAGCKPSTKPVEEDPDDPCAADAGADGTLTKGKVVCDGLPPIEDGLGEYLDEEPAEEEAP